ncbi:hypothetical protein Q3G72_018716 [Acer saccharum]|nr:hypothetical protein Q3G72_018716 [Acer saccharum]
MRAWCYYESRILGTQHSLILTYALETLVLYIFHVFDNPFAGPLEDIFCVNLCGPVPRSSILDMATVDPPRSNGGELLLSKSVYAYITAYTVLPFGQRNSDFKLKRFNIIDPLLWNNNLGISVSEDQQAREMISNGETKNYAMGTKNLFPWSQGLNSEGGTAIQLYSEHRDGTTNSAAGRFQRGQPSGSGSDTVAKSLSKIKNWLAPWGESIACLSVIVFDPSLFYLVVVNEDKKCLSYVKNQGIMIGLVLRSVSDFLFLKYLTIPRWIAFRENERKFQNYYLFVSSGDYSFPCFTPSATFHYQR